MVRSNGAGLLCRFSLGSQCFFCGSTNIFYFLVDGSSRWVVLQAGPAVAVELHSHKFPVAVWLLVELCQLAMRPRRGAAEAPCGGLCTDRLFVFRTIRAVGCFIFGVVVYSSIKHGILECLFSGSAAPIFAINYALENS